MPAERQRRRCQRCRRFFTPKRPSHRFCAACYQDIAPIGSTTLRRRLGAATRRHGGVSRLWADLPLTLHRRRDTPPEQPSHTTVAILKGIRNFLTDLYHRPTRMSTFLRQAGLDQDDIRSLRYGTTLDSLVLRLCPKLREWLIETTGVKATEVVVGFYGLYGDKRRPIADIARDLGLTESHAKALRGWALKRLRKPETQDELKALGAMIARDVLKAREK